MCHENKSEIISFMFRFLILNIPTQSGINETQWITNSEAPACCATNNQELALPLCFYVEEVWRHGKHIIYEHIIKCCHTVTTVMWAWFSVGGGFASLTGNVNTTAAEVSGRLPLFSSCKVVLNTSNHFSWQIKAPTPDCHEHWDKHKPEIDFIDPRLRSWELRNNEEKKKTMLDHFCWLSSFRKEVQSHQTEYLSSRWSKLSFRVLAKLFKTALNVEQLVSCVYVESKWQSHLFNIHILCVCHEVRLPSHEKW